MWTILQPVLDLKLKWKNPKEYRELIRKRRLERFLRKIEVRQKSGKDSRLITKVWLDERKNECDMCGACEAICPDVFEVPEKMVVKSNSEFKRNEFIKAAADDCPVGTIAIEFNNSGKRDYPPKI